MRDNRPMSALAVVAVLALAVLAGALAWLSGGEDPFLASCREVGLSPRPGGRDLPAHATGDIDGVRVFAGLCPEREVAAKRSRGFKASRVLLLMETGVLPGGEAGVDLADRRAWGDGRDAVLALLGDDVDALARALPQPSLLPSDRLGGLLDAAVRGRWPDGWNGLAIRAFLPPDADAERIGETFAAMRTLRDALVARSTPSLRPAADARTTA